MPSRYTGDPWDEIIAQFVEGLSSVSIDDVLRRGIQKPNERWNEADRHRVGRVLKSMGWKRRQVRVPEGRREWQYVRED